MTKLDQLIEELCPDGVEYQLIEKVCDISGGKDHKALKEGGVPVYGSGGVIRYVDSYIYDRESVLIPRKGSLSNLYYVNTPFWVVDTIFYTKIDENVINPKYFYYYLKTLNLAKMNTAGGVPSLTRTLLNKILVPIPPLSIQEEIVRILDKFTALEAELKAELEAELEARKKQYEYYRDLLLTFDESVPIMALGKICKNVSSGGTPATSRTDFYNGNIPWLRTQEVDWRDILDTEIKITRAGFDNCSAKWIPENCVIVAMYGATAAKVAINKIPLTTNQACCNLEIDASKALYRYVFHWLSKQYLTLKAMGQGSQSNINGRIIKGFKIPLPPLSEQQRIVDILDRFDTLVNDLTSGLPAEIGARRKQYEYYRDKLLTFKEVES